MNNTIYTIGYTGFSLSEFLNVLKNYKIQVVIDVRSSPYSERYPNYNRPNLEDTLKKSGIYYRNYADEFGARQDNPIYYTDGYLDFKKFSKSQAFQNGVVKIRNSLDKGYLIAFLCAEKDPIQCHRAILVSREFSDLGYNVHHILTNGKYETQQDIEQRLLAMFFPNGIQQDFFSEPLDLDTAIDIAYRKQNQKIGYQREEDAI